MVEVGDLRNIRTCVCNNEISEIVFVTALIMPIYLMLYDFAFERMGVQATAIALVLALVLYTVGIVWTNVSASTREKNEKDLAINTNHILVQGYRFKFFEQISTIDPQYTESRVQELIFVYPNYARLGISDGGRRGNKALLLEQQSAES